MNKNLAAEISAIVERLGYECVHVGFKSDSARLRLQILIDILGGVNLQDCENVSKAVNKFLDESQDDGINGAYYLEVSSPGLERSLYKLADYERFAGREARATLGEAVDGRKSLTGVIDGVDADKNLINFYLADEERVISVGLDKIKKCNLVWRAEELKVKS